MDFDITLPRGRVYFQVASPDVPFNRRLGGWYWGTGISVGVNEQRYRLPSEEEATREALECFRQMRGDLEKALKTVDEVLGKIEVRLESLESEEQLLNKYG